MLLNKMIKALQKEMEKEATSKTRYSPSVLSFGQAREEGGRLQPAIVMPPMSQSYQLDHPKKTGERKMFWRCYFNVVSCF